jgi:hypothetical protein
MHMCIQTESVLLEKAGGSVRELKESLQELKQKYGTLCTIVHVHMCVCVCVCVCVFVCARAVRSFVYYDACACVYLFVRAQYGTLCTIVHVHVCVRVHVCLCVHAQ